jgi:hypothetical protein
VKFSMAVALSTTVVASYTPPVHAQAAVLDAGRGALVASLDSAARAHVERPTVVGVSVAVVQRRRTLLAAGYGYVDLEWHVPTPADGGASYEIGSVTKQFTAAAVLLLAEDGKAEPVTTAYAGSLDELAGRFVGPARGRPLTVTVAIADDGLSVEPEGGAARTPVHEGGLTWADGGLLVTFVRERGRIVALRWDTGAGHYVLRREEG